LVIDFTAAAIKHSPFQSTRDLLDRFLVSFFRAVAAPLIGWAHRLHLMFPKETAGNSRCAKIGLFRRRGGQKSGQWLAPRYAPVGSVIGRAKR
jgi:hypothetical protein